MIITMTIDTTEKEFKRCMSVAWEHQGGDPLNVDDIKDFEIDDVVTETDVENMLKGSSLGELARECEVKMERTR